MDTRCEFSMPAITRVANACCSDADFFKFVLSIASNRNNMRR
jgi:hypothetical protein